MDSPPVPFPLVKSPPWHMKPGIILRDCVREDFSDAMVRCKDARKTTPT